MPRVPFKAPDTGSQQERESGRVIGLTRPPKGCALLASIALAAAVAQAEPCSMSRTPDIPVTMSGLQPMVRAQINGQDVLLLVDSGAFFSLLTPAAVAQYHLPDRPVPGLYVEGIGGHESARVARV